MREGIALLENIGETWAHAVALGVHGDVLAMQGDLKEAAAQYLECLVRLTAEGEPWTAVWSLVGLAAVAQAIGNEVIAARLVGVIDSRVEANGGMLEPTTAVRFAQTIEQLESSIEREHFARERAAGAALRPDEVVDEGRLLLAALGDASASSLLATPEPAEAGEAPALLTAREREVLVLVAEGLSDKAIAERLYISPRTVANHVNNMLGKLGVASRSAAVALAIRNRLI
jgi:DNA-binding NarL/FixJ family response regulator